MPTALGTWTETGTVTDQQDLMLALKTFAELKGWTTHRYDNVSADHELIMESPNGAFVGYKEVKNAIEDVYNWELQGYTSYNAGLGFHEQQGSLPYYGFLGSTSRDQYASEISLTNQPMTYWFNLFGDKIMIVAKIGSIYVSSYSGFIKRAASPLQYPYPMYIGGNSYGGSDGSNSVKQDNLMRFSDANNFNSNFIFGVGDALVTSSQQFNSRCRNYISLPSGDWLEIVGTGGTGFSNNPKAGFTFGNGYNRETALSLEKNFRDEYDIKSVIICSKLETNVTFPDILGEYFSCGVVAGSSILPEDVMSVGSDDYLAFPDVFRNQTYDFFVMKIE